MASVLALLLLVPVLGAGLAIAASANRAGRPADSSTIVLGAQTVGPHHSDLRPGRVDAFALRTRAAGTTVAVQVYVDGGSTVRTIAVGIYSDALGRPGSLLAEGSASFPRAGGWTTVAITHARLVAGDTYWLAVLGDGGVLRYRSHGRRLCAGGVAVRVGARRLPILWSDGATRVRPGCPISADVLAAPLAALALPGAAVLSPAPSSPAANASSGSQGSSPVSEHAPAEPETQPKGKEQPPQEESPHEEPPHEEPPPPPTNVTLPAVKGSAVEGETLKASTGTWSNEPTSYAYQWEDCATLGGGCMPISGASSSAYTLTPTDVGYKIRVVVTATNIGGSTPASSEDTSEVLPQPPTLEKRPKVSGITEVGKTLTGDPGKWKGSPTSFAYQWEGCNSSGADCAAIAGATESTHLLSSTDLGHTLRVAVKAANAGGAGEATSAVTTVVVPAGGGEGELRPNLSAVGCFEQPLIDVEGTVMGEGTARITACNYPTPENVGAERDGKTCSEKAPMSTSELETDATAGATIENKDITGPSGLTITSEHVTLRNDCLVLDGGGEGGAPGMENQANYFTMEYSTLRSGNSTTEVAERQFEDEGYGTTGVVLKKDVIEDCGGGGCIQGGAATGTNPEKTFELVESYVFPNAWMGEKASQEHDVHRENWFINQGKALARRDTLLNPGNAVAIIFGETADPDNVNHDEFVVEESLVAGSGQMFQEGKTTNEVNPEGFIFRNNRFARCLTTPLTEGGKKCSGPGLLGADSHGYFPKGPWLGDIVSSEPETFKQGVWENNFWDDNHEATAE